MSILLLALIGGAIGLVCAAAARMHTHRARFNAVCIGICGALLGGLWVSRVTGGGMLESAMATAFAALGILIGVRHWLVHRVV